MSSRRGQSTLKDGLRSYSISTASRRGDLRISGPLPHPLPASPDEQRLHASNPTSAASTSQTQQHSHSSLPSSARIASTNRDSHHVVSSHAPQDSVSTVASRDPHMQHRRRASTLRSVMRKLFGRKRNSHESDLTEDEQETGFPTQQTTTVNSGAPFSPIAEVRTRSRRSQSLPSQDFPFPEGTAISTTEQGRMSGLQPPNDDDPLRLPPSPHRRPRRRATLPSIILSPEETRELATRASRQTDRTSQVELTLVDRASCDTIPGHIKRRSRSANELRKLANSHLMSPIQWRRYSDETKPRKDSPRDDTLPPGPTRLASRSTFDDSAKGTEKASPPSPAPEDPNSDIAIDFGTLTGGMEDNNEASLAQRVGTLEVKLMDLEFAIAKLQGQEVSPFQRTGKGDSGLRTHQPDAATGLLNPPPLQDPGLHPSLTTPPRSSPAGDLRPESITTIRAQTSAARPSSSQESSSPDFRGISVEQYSALTTLVRREQTARKLLEDEVLQMRREMDQIRDKDQVSGPGSFYRPSSPDSFFDGSSSTKQGSKRGSSAVRSMRSRKDDSERNRSAASLPHTVISIPRHATSDRVAFRKRSNPDAAGHPRNQMPGMI